MSINLIDEVELRLKKGFEHADIAVDFSDGKHMFLEISSAEFAGLSLVDQHRKVYDCLQDLINDGYLHALKLKTNVK